jgi:hypothetical protein
MHECNPISFPQSEIRNRFALRDRFEFNGRDGRRDVLSFTVTDRILMRQCDL